MSLTIKPGCTTEVPEPATGFRVAPGCTVESLDPPVLSLSIDSEVGSIVLEWTQTAAPTTNEISRNQNDGGFSLLAAQSGALVEYEDVDGIGSGDVWCYTVKGISGSVESDPSNIACAVRDMIFLGTAVSQPTWQIAFGDFAPDDPSNLTSAQFPGLKRTGNLYMDTCALLTSTSYNFDSLVKVYGTANFAFSGMAILALPSVTDIDGILECGLMPNLTTLSAPALVNVNGDINADGCTSLVNVDLSSLIMQNGRSYNFDNCALSAASVNHILARAVASGVTSASIVMDNGTSVAPTGQGILDKAALLLAGNNVDTN